MAKLKATNPFYVVVVLVSIAFGITALAYASSTGIAQRDPQAARASIEKGEGLVALMDRYGFQAMMVELAILAVTMVLAMATDEFWTARAERKSNSGKSIPKQSASHERSDSDESESLSAS